jgi:iron complex outermembrane receptor protein
VFQGFAPSDASKHDRSNIGGYLDLETNLTTKLLANAAARVERYSDFGSKVTGKLAGRFQATPQFVVRGAASTGFRAPGLAQSWYSHTTTAIQNSVLVEIGNFPVANRASRIFGAKPLKEETSTNFSAGIAYSPLRTFNMTVDVYRIAIKDRILLGATFDGSTDPVIADILADSGLTQIAGVQFPTNAADTKTNGVDVAANWQIPTWMGTLDFTGAYNYTKNTITRIDPLPAILNGTGTNLTSALDMLTINAIERNRPNTRASLTTNYAAGRFRAMGRGSYYGSFWDGSSDGIEPFGAKTIFDAELGYRFNGVGVAVGSNNIFNTYPDQITVDANRNNGTFIYPGSSPYGYNGRYVYVRSEITLTR